MTRFAQSEKLLQHAQVLSAKKGDVLFQQGQSCQGLVYIESGAVRVYSLHPSGKETTLYTLHPGDICTISTSCLLSHQHYPASAVVEEDATLKLIAATQFFELLAQPDFRNFVFENFGDRLTQLMEKVDQLSHDSVLQRLLRLLLQTPQQALTLTHEEIAQRISSSREVVTRLLNKLANDGLIAQQRGSITVLNTLALQQRLT